MPPRSRGRVIPTASALSPPPPLARQEQPSGGSSPAPAAASSNARFGGYVVPSSGAAPSSRAARTASPPAVAGSRRGSGGGGGGGGAWGEPLYSPISQEVDIDGDEDTFTCGSRECLLRPDGEAAPGYDGAPDGEDGGSDTDASESHFVAWPWRLFEGKGDRLASVAVTCGACLALSAVALIVFAGTAWHRQREHKAAENKEKPVAASANYWSLSGLWAETDAPRHTGGTMPFTIIAEGTCSELGLWPILDVYTCETAALLLQLQDNEVQFTPDLGRPEGCYALRSLAGASLWMSMDERNRGNGASSAEGYSRNPLCTAQPPDLPSFDDGAGGGAGGGGGRGSRLFPLGAAGAGDRVEAAMQGISPFLAEHDDHGNGGGGRDGPPRFQRAGARREGGGREGFGAGADGDRDFGDVDVFGQPVSSFGGDRFSDGARADAGLHPFHFGSPSPSPTTQTWTSTSTTRTTTTPPTTRPPTTTVTRTPGPYSFRWPPHASAAGDDGSGADLASSCLKMYEPGCYTIKDETACLSSRDGRGAAKIDGRRVHGQPCVWCGGEPCTKGGGSLCEPYDWLAKSPGFDLVTAAERFSLASCPELDSLRPPTLYCWALMLPYGYEPGLLRRQLAESAGLFACDEYALFSNESVSIEVAKGGLGVKTLPIEGDLSVSYGGKWNTALNTGPFVRAWRAVALVGRYRHHDWTVKVDPDSVFFPSRLQELLMRRPLSSVLEPADEPAEAEADDFALGGGAVGGGACGHCLIEQLSERTCQEHVQALEKNGFSCDSALLEAAKAPPTNCGCHCGRHVCSAASTGMYVNNCRFGLHGPIEVLSREAVDTYAAGWRECDAISKAPFGEDKYLRRCLRQLGVRRVDEFDLLNEIACAEQPAPCTSASVAFHPFKDEASYFDCWRRAKSEGSWP